ncbi:hypothetical protein FGO68_gene15088 [Halteria grandinella]|uniref:Uncharacterized protein n=1 Tax=Halteria grandinella TaxID=5974 RepID=A0A8J8NKA8_HALGN|nr:hypothetical protein FGO68_gene15088 [Halteria grandinella]
MLTLPVPISLHEQVQVEIGAPFGTLLLFAGLAFVIFGNPRSKDVLCGFNLASGFFCLAIAFIPSLTQSQVEIKSPFLIILGLSLFVSGWFCKFNQVLTNLFLDLYTSAILLTVIVCNINATPIYIYIIYACVMIIAAFMINEKQRHNEFILFQNAFIGSELIYIAMLMFFTDDENLVSFASLPGQLFVVLGWIIGIIINVMIYGPPENKNVDDNYIPKK